MYHYVSTSTESGIVDTNQNDQKIEHIQKYRLSWIKSLFGDMMTYTLKRQIVIFFRKKAYWKRDCAVKTLQSDDECVDFSPSCSSLCHHSTIIHIFQSANANGKEHWPTNWCFFKITHILGVRDCWNEFIKR